MHAIACEIFGQNYLTKVNISLWECLKKSALALTIPPDFN
jgi:hypothetical protein